MLAKQCTVADSCHKDGWKLKRRQLKVLDINLISFITPRFQFSQLPACESPFIKFS
jgi:hypothetical protein